MQRKITNITQPKSNTCKGAPSVTFCWKLYGLGKFCS